MSIEAPNQSQDIARMAGLLADTSRSTMVLVLLDGRAYTASELARAANVSPQTASFHLGKLYRANFVQIISQGRYRYYRLAGPEIAQALESFLAISSAPAPEEIPTRCPRNLRAARCCYDHLAGKVGVAIYRAMLANSWIVPNGQYLIATTVAMSALVTLEIPDDPASMRGKPCLDWSEREFHLAGDLGRILLCAMLDKRWLLRGEARAITLTEEGRRHLGTLGLLGMV